MPAGFVITENESNEEYLASWEGDAWEPILRATHERMRLVDPDYRIIQIKEKFWSLRYYFEASAGLPEEKRAELNRIVSAAEAAIELREGRLDVDD